MRTFITIVQIILLLAVAILGLTYCWPARAQGIACGDYHDMAVKLAEKFGEISFATGTMEVGMVEMWANPITGTFTILSVAPQGGACVLAAGNNFDIGVGRPTEPNL